MRFLITKTSSTDGEYVRDFDSIEALVLFVRELPVQAATRGVSRAREVVLRAEDTIPVIEIYDTYRE